MADLGNLMNAHAEGSSRSEHPGENEPVPAGENKYLYHAQKGLQLCAGLISVNPVKEEHHVILDELEGILQNDFLELTRDDENSGGAEAFYALTKLHRAIVEKVNFPNLEKFFTVAVGGMFSAGKSRFLNSVLGCPSLLPTDTIPTTAIPTYISKGEKDSVFALNYHRKKTKIDTDALKAVCHAFNEKYGVTFSHILRLISIERMDFKYPSLTFLDTPGYSKSDNAFDKSENADENIAKKHLRNTDYLIWLVDCQSGTVPITDINFISRLDIDQPVLFVISKADKKTPGQIQKIIETAKKDLNKNNIAYYDVIAYSAAKNKEFSTNGNVINSFFKKISAGRSGSCLVWRANRIFEKHLAYYGSEKESLRSTLEMANKLLFDDNVDKKNKEILKILRARTLERINSLSMHEKQAKKIRDDFIDGIKMLCKKVDIRIAGAPNKVQIEAFKKNNLAEAGAYRFKAIFEAGTGSGDVTSGDFNKIKGIIKKTNAMGLWIESEYGHKVFATMAAIKKELGDNPPNDFFPADSGVAIQFTSSKDCVVQYET